MLLPIHICATAPDR